MARAPGLWLRAGAIPVLAWGLSAFWFTPSYLKITSEDLRLVSLPSTTSSQLVFAIAMALFGSAIEGELGEFHPADLWDMADKTAALARDYPRWPHYREQAQKRWHELSRRNRLHIPCN